MSFLNEWKAKLPDVAATLTAAFIVFIASTVAYQFRDFLYPQKQGMDYPLLCRAEVVPGEPNGPLTTEFYVVNKTDQSFTNAALVKLLNYENKDRMIKYSPNIVLKRFREFDAVVGASQDEEFNKTKGELVVKQQANSRDIEIEVKYIKPRAILKATIVVSGLADAHYMERTDKTQLPFVAEPYEIACYN